MSANPNAVLDTRNRPLRDLRISVTDRCNFRCGYCMPKDVFGKGYKFLRQNQLLSFGEIERLVRVFAGFGVSKLRLTGGEPLLRRNIEDLVAVLGEVDGIQDIAMTTNASLLTRQRVSKLRQAGLDRLNISLDALDPAIYQRINEVNTPLEQVLAGIDYSLEAGFKAVKINMVVQKGINDTDILPMVRKFRNTGAILRFIEFMDVGNHNQWSLDQVCTASEIVNMISEHFEIEPMDPNYRGEVAQRWRYTDGGGEIGVISSISQPFCGSCARARLSAIGELFTCLFATSGFDLRSLLRAGYDDRILTSTIEEIWSNRNDNYSEVRFSPDQIKSAASKDHKVEMSYIGG